MERDGSHAGILRRRKPDCSASSVKTMEMSNPYKCTATIFLLMTLYTLLAATLMMVFNLMKNKFGGVLSVFILNLYGLLLDPPDDREDFEYSGRGAI